MPVTKDVKVDKAVAKAKAEEAKAAVREKAAALKAAEAAKKAREKEKENMFKKLQKEKEEKSKAAAKAKAEKEKEKAAKAAERAKAKEAKAAEKKEKKEKAVLEPVWVEQVNEKGEMELIDKNKFPFEIQCDTPGCNNVRYVNASGLLQVTKCKLCAKKDRRRRRVAGMKQKTKQYRTIVQAALDQGLFPDDFKKKHGLA